MAASAMASTEDVRDAARGAAPSVTYYKTVGTLPQKSVEARMGVFGMFAKSSFTSNKILHTVNPAVQPPFEALFNVEGVATEYSLNGKSVPQDCVQLVNAYEICKYHDCEAFLVVDDGIIKLPRVVKTGTRRFYISGLNVHYDTGANVKKLSELAIDLLIDLIPRFRSLATKLSTVVLHIARPDMAGALASTKDALVCPITDESTQLLLTLAASPQKPLAAIGSVLFLAANADRPEDELMSLVIPTTTRHAMLPAASLCLAHTGMPRVPFDQPIFSSTDPKQPPIAAVRLSAAPAESFIVMKSENLTRANVHTVTHDPMVLCVASKDTKTYWKGNRERKREGAPNQELSTYPYPVKMARLFSSLITERVDHWSARAVTARKTETGKGKAAAFAAVDF